MTKTFARLHSMSSPRAPEFVDLFFYRADKEILITSLSWDNLWDITNGDELIMDRLSAGQNVPIKIVVDDE